MAQRVYEKTLNAISHQGSAIQGCGEIGSLAYCWWECTMVQLLWKASQKLKIKLHMIQPSDLSIEMRISKSYEHSRVHCSTTHNYQDVGTT